MGEAPDRPLIRGRKVWFRAWERADLPIRQHWLRDAKVMRTLDEPAPIGAGDEERWFENVLAQQGKEWYRFAVCRLGEDRPIGAVMLGPIDWRHGSAELGIYVGETDEWGKGHGTDAVDALVDFAFGELRMERVWLRVIDWNAGAIRSYQKAGFVTEGTLRHMLHQHGRWVDCIQMSLLRDEWAALPRPKGWELGAAGEPG